MKQCACLLVASLTLSLPSWAVDIPLFDAIRRDDIATVQALLKGGTHADVRDETGTTALMYAGIYASPAMLQLLLDKGADPSAANNNGSTALMWATGNTAKVRLLVERGA